MRRSWFRLFDPNPRLHGCWPVKPEDAYHWNEQGWGIYWTVNEIGSIIRSKASIVKVNSWYFETDQGAKDDQFKRIMGFLEPSLVVETKRGFHVYFHAKDGTRENWNSIVRDRLLYWYQADPAVHDIARILRVPGFYHCKDPARPFLIRIVYESQAKYREKDLLSYFPLDPKRARERERKTRLRHEPHGPGFDLWDRIYEMDCEVALEILSGTAAVFGETYSFKPTSCGKLNIFVNGKETSCWIDENKRIGSRTGGGPCIINWLKWLGHSNAEAMQIMREHFPSLFEERKAG